VCVHVPPVSLYGPVTASYFLVCFTQREAVQVPKSEERLSTSTLAVFGLGGSIAAFGCIAGTGRCTTRRWIVACMYTIIKALEAERQNSCSSHDLGIGTFCGSCLVQRFIFGALSQPTSGLIHRPIVKHVVGTAVNIANTMVPSNVPMISDLSNRLRLRDLRTKGNLMKLPNNKTNKPA
jgi:hypothetical protein